jgi:hypothetical protein
MLVFTDTVPGDDGVIAEKKRVLALLDLPRPEVILNVWTMQASSKDGDLVGRQTNSVNQLVKEYNGILESAVERGWRALRDDISDPSRFFDATFYTYLVGKYVGVSERDDSTPETPERVAQRVVGGAAAEQIPPEVRAELGLCPENQYCLGYGDLFQPITPRLTDLLITVIAAKYPWLVAQDVINQMEKAESKPKKAGETWAEQDSPSESNDNAYNERRTDCAARDEDGVKQHRFFIECFREAARREFSTEQPESVKELKSNAQNKCDQQQGCDDQQEAHRQEQSPPTLLGLLRASLADFLYEYKMSQLYPHEFSFYQLSRSAHALDSALSPLIEAFNRDLAAYQTALTKYIGSPEAKSAGWVGAEKDTFSNQGLITVRTISGTDTTVNTTTQNFLDVTQQPTLSALASSIQGAKQSDTTTGAHMTDVFQNLTPIQAQVILGAVAAFQTSKVQIGRSINIDVTPRSLSGADSAELNVKLNVDEAASPTYYSSSQSSSADISRVANHDTNTHIRVDSIKLFNVSTMTAELQKARTRFPLLPPLVEIPYIGTLVGVPLPPAKEFHSSSAIISAIVVPTASDIALGLNFTPDNVVDAEGASECQWTKSSEVKWRQLPRCRLRRVPAYADIDRYKAVSLFHQQMITCIANGNKEGTPTIKKNGDNTELGTTKDCGNISLKNLELGTE